MRVEATWRDGFTVTARFRRRWFPWPTDSVVFGKTVWTRLKAPSPAHVRHELTHVRQYVERGWWWVLTHPKEREHDAHDAHTATEPAWRVIS